MEISGILSYQGSSVHVTFLQLLMSHPRGGAVYKTRIHEPCPRHLYHAQQVKTERMGKVKLIKSPIRSALTTLVPHG